LFMGVSSKLEAGCLCGSAVGDMHRLNLATQCLHARAVGH
jgi:hypothetical protein